MRVGILGGGFGLYGYLPAILACSDSEILLPARYRQTLGNRGDIRQLIPAVSWLEDDEAVLSRSEALVVSRRPGDQAGLMAGLSAHAAIGRVLLEKPVACTPREAGAILAPLFDDGRHVRIGYTFRLTKWGRELGATVRELGPNGTLKIQWRFRAHHYAAGLSNWKRMVSCGGGAMRFYGIHLIALLADLGYRDVRYSNTSAAEEDEAETWDAILTGDGLPDCEINVSSNAGADEFIISTSAGGSNLVSQRGPFGEAGMTAGLDPRVPILMELCREWLLGDDSLQTSYEQATGLWNLVEQRNETVTGIAA